MNKTFCKKNQIFSLILAGCLILFNTSCGLDTFYVIDPPKVTHEPSYDTQTQDELYFKFSTVESDYEGITFLGTEVYYKIYNSTSRLNTETSSIYSAANNESSSNQSANLLIDKYGYQTLRNSEEPGANILIPYVNNHPSSKEVEIRLSDFPEYPAKYSVDGSQHGIPVRSISKKTSFNFKELTGTDDLPKSTEPIDADYAYTSTTEEINAYYVALFAIAVARDSTYTPAYSTAVYLGSVKISLEN